MLVKLSFRRVIDATSTDAFARTAAKLSYDEFLMKSQNYNPEMKFKTFSEMKAADGRANSMHYKLNFPVGGLINVLKNKIPDVRDLGGKEIEFEYSEFQLIESHIEDSTQHVFAITFVTPPLRVVMSYGDTLVLEKAGAEADANTGFRECFTVKTDENIFVSHSK